MAFRTSSYSNPNGACVDVGEWSGDGFRTATFSVANGACVDVGEFRASQACQNSECVECAPFRVSSHSAGSNCVQVADYSGIVVRDSKQKDEGYPDRLRFPARAWDVFLAGIRAGSVPQAAG